MAQNVLSISQLNEYIRSKLDSDTLLSSVAVRGEISNYKVYPSGHHYFSLKDEGGAIRCVMFRGNAMSYYDGYYLLPAVPYCHGLLYSHKEGRCLLHKQCVRPSFPNGTDIQLLTSNQRKLPAHK